MSKDLTQENAYIFRIVHMENVRGVLADGCLSRSAAAGHRYVDIGNLDLIAKRTTRIVPCPPGGTLSDYVPFYFTPFSPMLLNIKTGYNGVERREMKDIVILVSSIHKLTKLNVPFIFTDRHAYLRTAAFSSQVSDLDRIIWPVLQVRDFKKDDTDKVEKYQAEALVHHKVPMSCLLGMACFDDSAKSRVEAEAAALNVSIKVITKRDWFF